MATAELVTVGEEEFRRGYSPRIRFSMEVAGEEFTGFVLVNPFGSSEEMERSLITARMLCGVIEDGLRDRVQMVED